MKDYSQPEFYKFSSDSIDIAKLALKEGKCFKTILDIGCGCGVIALEVMRSSKSKAKCILIEKNPKFESHIIKNIEWLNLDTDIFINIMDFRDFSIEDKFDLILFNPPYFDPLKARISNKSDKDYCRFLINLNMKDYYSFLQMNLKENGVCIFSIRDKQLLNDAEKYNLSTEIIDERNLTFFVRVKLNKNRD